MPSLPGGLIDGWRGLHVGLMSSDVADAAWKKRKSGDFWVGLYLTLGMYVGGT